MSTGAVRQQSSVTLGVFTLNNVQVHSSPTTSITWQPGCTVDNYSNYRPGKNYHFCKHETQKDSWEQRKSFVKMTASTQLPVILFVIFFVCLLTFEHLNFRKFNT